MAYKINELIDALEEGKRENQIDALLKSVNRRDGRKQTKKFFSRFQTGKNMFRRFFFNYLVATVVLALLLYGGYKLLGGNAGYIDDTFNSLLDKFKETSSKIIPDREETVPIKVEQEEQVSQPEEVEEEKTPPRVEKTPERVTDTFGSYYIQVAYCGYGQCRNSYSSALKRRGFDFRIDDIQKTPSIEYYEITSKKGYSQRTAEEIAEFINSVNEKSGYATVSSSGNGLYSISMGVVPDIEFANQLQDYYNEFQANSVYPEEISFQVKRGVSQESKTFKILAGPFTTKEKASRSLTLLKKEYLFRDAFITSQ